MEIWLNGGNGTRHGNPIEQHALSEPLENHAVHKVREHGCKSLYAFVLRYIGSYGTFSPQDDVFLVVFSLS